MYRSIMERLHETRAIIERLEPERASHEAID